jgi:hypothetical protein
VAAIYFDLRDVPQEIQSTIQINHWGDMIFKKKKLSENTRELFKMYNENIIFFHINTLSELDRLIEHLSLITYKRYFFINSSFCVADTDQFLLFLGKIKFVEESLAVYKNEEIKSFLRLRKDEIIPLLRLLRQDSSKLFNTLKVQFDSKVERFRLEQFYIDIRNYLDFVQFLHSNFGLRYFNSIEQKEDIIIKKSTDKKKMKMEYTYYHLLPESLKYYFLPTFSYREEADCAQYSLERLSVPDLAIQWIHLSIDDEQFQKLLSRLFGFLSVRQKRKIDAEAMRAHCDSLYLGKVESRFEKLRKMPVYEKLQKIFSSSTQYASIEALFDRYKILYAKLSKSKSFGTEQAVGHGDFCFSNMLYDKRLNLLKLIDPKGGLTLEDTFIDSYYDVAKLSHSILGNYDFVNSGQYELHYDTKLNVSLEIRYHENLLRKKQLFHDCLIEKGYDLRVVRLCELSLFLSMLPLHVDNEKNVLGFLLIACAILDELEKTEI